MRAPSKNTSLNSLPPVSIRIGRTSTPGVSIGHNRNEMPRCFGTVGSVRASTKIQLAWVANEVQIFCPSITHSSPSSVARVRQAREVGARVRLGEPLAPGVLPREDARQEPALLLLGPPLQERVAHHLHGDGVAGRAERHHRPRTLLHQHDLLQLAHAAAAVLGRPGQAEQPVLVQGAPPAGDELGRFVGRQRADTGPVGGQVLGEEPADPGPERLGVGGGAEVHHGRITEKLTNPSS